MTDLEKRCGTCEWFSASAPMSCHRYPSPIRTTPFYRCGEWKLDEQKEKVRDAKRRDEEPNNEA
jgi:hypothetical protein